MSLNSLSLHLVLWGFSVCLSNTSNIYQGYKGITISDKLMCIPKDDTQNNPFCTLILEIETQFKKSNNQNSKVPKENVIIKLWGLV